MERMEPVVKQVPRVEAMEKLVPQQPVDDRVEMGPQMRPLDTDGEQLDFARKAINLPPPLQDLTEIDHETDLILEWIAQHAEAQVNRYRERKVENTE